MITRYLICLLFPIQLYASTTSLLENVTASMGMVSVSISENESSLESTDDISNDETTESEISPITPISLELQYNFQNYLNKSVYLKTIFPLVTEDGSGYYLGAIGLNYYLNSQSSIFSFKDEGTTLRLSHKTRYYLGGYLGAGYLIYNTTSAKKSDLMLDITGLGGLSYSLKKDWSLFGEIGASRLTGINTSGFGMKVFFGGTFFLSI